MVDKPKGLGLNHDLILWTLLGKKEVVPVPLATAHQTVKDNFRLSAIIFTECEGSSVRSFQPEVQLCQSSIPGKDYGVMAKSVIPKGLGIGPYEGKLVDIDEVHKYKDGTDMWEVFHCNYVRYFIHGLNASSWMRFIQCARNKNEQNAGVFQYKGRIYYRTLRDINIGEEILVWYDNSYHQYMGIPIIHYDKGFITGVGDHETNKSTSGNKRRQTMTDHDESTPENKRFLTSDRKQGSNPEKSFEYFARYHGYSFDNYIDSFSLHGNAPNQDNNSSSLLGNAPDQDNSSSSLHGNAPDQDNHTSSLHSYRLDCNYNSSGIHRITIDNDSYSFSHHGNPPDHNSLNASAHGNPTDYKINSSRRHGNSPGHNFHHDGNPFSNSFQGNKPYYAYSSSVDECTSPLQCTQCCETFPQRAILQMHVCSKQTNTPFHCGQCCLSFSKPSDLRRHVICHLGEKPFKCGLCARSFVGATTLNNHIQIHLGRRLLVKENS